MFTRAWCGYSVGGHSKEGAMQTLAAVVGLSRGQADTASNLVELAAGVALPGIILSFARNEEVFAEEDEADFVYKVISGAVRDVRILGDGRRHVGAFHLPGDVFGLECQASHASTAEAITDCRIALVRRSLVEKAAAEDATVARALWTLTARDLQAVQDHMVLLGRKTATERVVSFLLRLAGRSGSSDIVDLAMPRSDIADYLGLTIETVSRTFSQLERDKAIAIPHSRHIVLGERLALIGE
jgi:CRP/FNR family nitrogen fixation transcriptional regulator